MKPRCPTCRQPVDPQSPATSRYLPFCSERCQWVDLGKWLAEEYVVPGPPADDEEPSDPLDRSRQA